MSRTMTGFVPGGMQSYVLPPGIDPGELAVHAVGRLDTMSEILLQASFLRSVGAVSQTTGFVGALFQDVKGDYSGTNRIAAAHRALFTLQLDGRNAAHVPSVFVRPRLRNLVVAPQARTDLVIRPVNYADQLLENAISPQIFALFRSTLMMQRPNRPLEQNLLSDNMWRLKDLLHTGFDLAADSYQRLQGERGWVPGSGGFEPFADLKDADLEHFLDRGFGIHVQGPTHYSDLPGIVLGLSQEITDRAGPQLAQPAPMEAAVEELREALGR